MALEVSIIEETLMILRRDEGMKIVEFSIGLTILRRSGMTSVVLALAVARCG